MMSKSIHITMFCLLSALMVSSCSEKHSTLNKEDGNLDIALSTNNNDTMVRYAKAFTIENQSNCKLITVFDPWKKSGTYKKYLLVPKGESVSIIVPDAIVVEIPVVSVVSLSTTHTGMLDKLGLLENISGVGDIRFTYNNELRERVQSGLVTEVGELQDLNVEMLLVLAPDLVLLTGWQEINPVEKRLEGCGISMAHDLDWMETTPLGRAEWVKFIAAFFCMDHKADSLFNTMEKEYKKMSSIALNVNTKPKILHGFNMGGTWFVPGGNSYIANLYKDAGTDYLWKDDSTSGSIPLSLELVIDRALNADFWFNATMTDTACCLQGNNEITKQIKAYKNRNMYCNNGKSRKSGGNDYWESGIINPDILLKDIIKITHPELLPNYTIYFYKQQQSY